MNKEVKFILSKATEEDIVNHLLHCDTDFIPPLSDRVDIDTYAHKITNKSMRFEAWDNEILVGLVAIYCNDSEHRIAYITSVSVLPEWQNKGIASQLIKQCVENVKSTSFELVELEVNSDNLAAIKSYEKNNFIINKINGRSIFMQLKIREEM